MMSPHNRTRLRHRVSAIRTLAIQALLATLVTAECYDYDGVLGNYDGIYPCGNGTNSCCWDGFQCGSNSLCMEETTSTWAEAIFCDNESWEGCPRFCPVWPLPECGPNIFCCPTEENNYDCDCDTDQTWFVDPHTGEVSDTADVDMDDAAAGESPLLWPVNKALASTESTATTETTTASEPTRDVFTATSSFSRSRTSTTPTSSTSFSDFDVDASSYEGSSKEGISGGAIGGIVVGVLAGLAVMIGVASFLLHTGPSTPAKVPGVEPAPGGYGYVATKKASSA